MALSVEASQTTCSFLPYGRSFTINITYSNNPLEGLQVRRRGLSLFPCTYRYLPHRSYTTEPTRTRPAGFGAQIISQGNCFGFSPQPPTCFDGILCYAQPDRTGFQLHHVRFHLQPNNNLMHRLQSPLLPTQLSMWRLITLLSQAPPGFAVNGSWASFQTRAQSSRARRPALARCRRRFCLAPTWCRWGKNCVRARFTLESL